MIISIGSDHAGFKLKEVIINYLESKGHTVNNAGTSSQESCDYPDFANIVCEQVLENSAERGVLICGSGIGMSIAANRNSGIRAALCTSEEMALKARLHNDANILVLGAKIISEEQALKFLDIFLSAEFEGGRHAGRLNKIR